MAVCNLSELPSLLKTGTCLLGIDPGSKTIGIAVSDPGLTVASPLTTIERKKFAEDAAALVRIIRERNIGGLVVGLPKTMEGAEGPAAQSARALVRNLVEKGEMPDPNMPIAFWDERFSTAAVERDLIEADMSRTKRAAKIDRAAAAYILQGALDALRALKRP